MLPLLRYLVPVLRGDLRKLRILHRFEVLWVPVAEKLLLLWQADEIGVPLGGSALIVLYYEEQG